MDGNGNSITDPDHIGNINPFRYRGYYYDVETGLYYLQTRYYDPFTGRFLNRDSVTYADPSTVHGLNLYAYCGNNPVNYADPTGRVAGLIALIVGAVLLFTPVGGAIVQGATSLLCYFGFAVASLWDEQIKADMNAIGWNPFNTDESAVLQSGKVSFYKGVPVIRYIGPGNRSGSFAAIFLDISEDSTNTIRHEWGHTIQQLILGPGGYMLMIGLPSAFEWSNRYYYSRPWEITADIFGGVSLNAPDRAYTNADIYRGFSYLGVSSIAGIFGYLFLFGEYF